MMCVQSTLFPLAMTIVGTTTNGNDGNNNNNNDDDDGFDCYDCNGSIGSTIETTTNINGNLLKNNEGILVVVNDNSKSLYQASSSPSSSSSFSRRYKKRVQFDLSRTTIATSSASSLAADELWYTKAELEQMKKATYALGKAIYQREGQQQQQEQQQDSSSSMPSSAQYGSSYQYIMNRVYEVGLSTSNQDDDMYDSDDETMIDDTPSSLFSSFSEEELSLLMAWTKVPERVGLEKWCVRSIGKDRFKRRPALLQTLQELQDEARRNLPSLADRMEYIREWCEPLTRPSRTIATVLACASAQEEEQEQQ